MLEIIFYIFWGGQFNFCVQFHLSRLTPKLATIPKTWNITIGENLNIWASFLTLATSQEADWPLILCKLINFYDIKILEYNIENSRARHNPQVPLFLGRNESNWRKMTGNGRKCCLSAIWYHRQLFTPKLLSKSRHLYWVSKFRISRIHPHFLNWPVLAEKVTENVSKYHILQIP